MDGSGAGIFPAPPLHFSGKGYVMFGKPSGVEWIVACLGNPGSEYANTRHNMGFLTADLIAEREHVKINKIKFKSAYNIFPFGGAKVLLMKPQTYMNLSGEAVVEAVKFYKVPLDHLLVIFDDIYLPVGKIRIRPSGSAGGHNGIKNIIAHLGSDQFPRIKIGVGSPSNPDYDMADWVLGTPSMEDRKILLNSFARAADAAEAICSGEELRKAMGRFN